MTANRLRLIQTRDWEPVHISYARRDQLPTRSSIIGDVISYACGADGFDPLHHTAAHRRLKAGKPLFYTTWMECHTDQDVVDARAIRRFRVECPTDTVIHRQQN